MIPDGVCHGNGLVHCQPEPMRVLDLNQRFASGFPLRGKAEMFLSIFHNAELFVPEN